MLISRWRRQELDDVDPSAPLDTVVDSFLTVVVLLSFEED
jgi:hypothetical protein